MIEIVTSELVSFDAIRVAGELIATDATFCSRMAEMQGRSDARLFVGGLKLYQEQIDQARNVWSAFKTASTTALGPNLEAQASLVESLTRIKATLERFAETRPRDE
jgi:hypothetical protein